MWSIDSYWFDISILMLFFTVGNIIFGHFEAHKQAWKRLLKFAIFSIALVSVLMFFGRLWFYTLFILMLTPPLFIHLWWLPKYGINGLTGEPKEKYYQLIKYDNKRK